jgi:hypothetical protein
MGRSQINQPTNGGGGDGLPWRLMSSWRLIIRGGCSVLGVLPTSRTCPQSHHQELSHNPQSEFVLLIHPCASSAAEKWAKSPPTFLASLHFFMMEVGSPPFLGLVHPSDSYNWILLESDEGSEWKMSGGFFGRQEWKKAAAVAYWGQMTDWRAAGGSESMSSMSLPTLRRKNLIEIGTWSEDRGICVIINRRRDIWQKSNAQRRSKILFKWIR